MTETAHAPVLMGRASDEKDGSPDEEPGPSCFDFLIEFEGWRRLDGVRQTVLRAYEACVQKLPAISDREVSLLLSGDDAVAALNGRYRGQNKPTNVLSFPAATRPSGLLPSQEHAPLGDIIIAYETVMREAGEADKPPLFHLAHLTVHGLLHLAGFDHQTDGEAERMETLEREILSSIGIPDPYPTTLEEQPVFAG